MKVNPYGWNGTQCTSTCYTNCDTYSGNHSDILNNKHG